MTERKKYNRTNFGMKERRENIQNEVEPERV